MAVWPALLMMEEVQMRYADEHDGTGVQPVSYSGQLPH
jgi:hypothetical protein